MKKSQVKSMFIIFMLFMLMMIIAYAVSTTLLSPADNFVDTDSFLDLRGSCAPTAHDGTTSYNVSNATLYTDTSGTWIGNITLEAHDSVGNATYLFNFTNHLNTTAEGEYKWNIQCEEYNTSSTDHSQINKAFAGNRSIRVLYARPTVSVTSPADGSYSLNGHEIDVRCNGIPSGGWNITNVSLMTDINGNWEVNQTYNLAHPEGAGTVIANFTINKFGNESIASGTDLLFGCRFHQWFNKTGGLLDPVTTERTTSNRTIKIRYPPIITLDKPDDNNWSKNKKVNMNFTPYVEWETGTQFSCRVWTNESGLWSPKTGNLYTTNNSGISQDVTHLEKIGIKWGAQCFDASDANVFNFTDNRTLNIDATNPTIVINSPEDDSLVNNETFTISTTATDANLAAVKVFHNFNDTAGESVDTGPTSGGAVLFNYSTIVDGVYNFSVWANDSSGREVQSVNYTITVDSTPPDIFNIINVSTPSCLSRNLTWETNETTNYTIYLDTVTDVANGVIGTQTTYGFNNSFIFYFNSTGAEILWYFNITSCDQAGNCNTSNQMTFDTPATVCAGWSQYAVYDATINLSEIQNQSGADLVYFWNQTNQDWIFKTAGLTTNDDVAVGKSTPYHVVHLFEDTNDTWFRTTANPGVYNYNVTEGDNFLSIPSYHNFGNLSDIFMNESHVFPSYVNQSSTDFNGGSAGHLLGPFNITHISGFNTTLQDYVSHIYNFSWANETILEPCPNRLLKDTCMETFWVASDYNVSVNGSQVYANWSGGIS